MSTFDLRPLPGGQVELHDARRKRRWTVHLEPFEIGIAPVTVAQYSQLMGDSETGTQAPLVDINWLEAIKFCNEASLNESLSPAYIFEADEVIWQTNASGYRLPTEAEWEYACRAGTVGPHYGHLDAIAWTANDKLENAKEVGQNLPNAFGLHDTLGTSGNGAGIYSIRPATTTTESSVGEVLLITRGACGLRRVAVVRLG